jgi:hypothetical protein
MELVLHLCWPAYRTVRCMDLVRSRVTHARARRSCPRHICLAKGRRGRSALVCVSGGSNRPSVPRPVRCSLVLGCTFVGMDGNGMCSVWLGRSLAMAGLGELGNSVGRGGCNPL